MSTEKYKLPYRIALYLNREFCKKQKWPGNGSFVTASIDLIHFAWLKHTALLLMGRRDSFTSSLSKWSPARRTNATLQGR
jgi:hypothetical protein